MADDNNTTIPAAQAAFLDGTSIELVRPLSQREPPQHVLFDFDGTLSLIREGWIDVMTPMMVEILQETGTDETPAQLTAIVEHFVAELTGKQTIYQMIRLAEEISKRDGTPLEPLAYKHMYHERLMSRIASRREALRSGQSPPDEMLVPGSTQLLEHVIDRGATVHLASGTDEVYVREEAELLGLIPYFGPRIYGAVDDYRSFSKAQVIARILEQDGVKSEGLVGFGDGYVEIENVKQAGGIAVGVASDEAERSGRPDPWKRERLIGVGAHIIVPDFRESQQLVDYLWTCEND